MLGLKTAHQLQKEESRTLAPYAMKSALSAGRVHKEAEDPYRLPFQRDRDRVIHCKAFRRLQAKTQVFVSYFGDHFRDRLTHSIEVAQIARDISRTLGLNEDLAECLSLAHDLGHPPFGHGGEFALDEMMKKHKLHFEHNEQSRRIIEKLEKIYPAFDGLNPTKEVLDGLLKHNPHSYTTYIDFEISPHLESQVMDLSDEIAYLNHDVDDGLRSGIIKLKDISDFAIWKNAEKEVVKKYGRQIASHGGRYKSRIISKMISRMIHDLCDTTQANLKKYRITDLQKVRKARVKLTQFSPAMQKQIAELRVFLMKNFYLDPQVNSQIEKGKKIIKKLFLYYIEKPGKLPAPFQAALKASEALPVVVKDYIAGMTDHYAEETWHKLKV
jgi:dGTPase